MAVKVIKIFEIVNFRGVEIPQCEKNRVMFPKFRENLSKNSHPSHQKNQNLPPPPPIQIGRENLSLKISFAKNKK